MLLVHWGFFYALIVVTLGDFIPPGFEDVTSAKSVGSIEAVKQCGDDVSQGRHICVTYNLCNAQTKTIDQSGKVDGFGIIDIRYYCCCSKKIISTYSIVTSVPSNLF